MVGVQRYILVRFGRPKLFEKFDPPTNQAELGNMLDYFDYRKVTLFLTVFVIFEVHLNLSDLLPYRIFLIWISLPKHTG